MIHGILVKDNTLQEIDLDGSLETFYAELNCEIITAPSINIGGRYFSVVCDDEGLYKDGPIAIMHKRLHVPILVGTIFICRTKDSDFDSLTAEDVKIIKDEWQHHVLWGEW